MNQPTPTPTTEQTIDLLLAPKVATTDHNTRITFHVDSPEIKQLYMQILKDSGTTMTEDLKSHISRFILKSVVDTEAKTAQPTEEIQETSHV